MTQPQVDFLPAQYQATLAAYAVVWYLLVWTTIICLASLAVVLWVAAAL